MTEQRFQECYRHLIGAYQLTPERASTQLAVILSSCFGLEPGIPPDVPGTPPKTETKIRESGCCV